MRTVKTILLKPHGQSGEMARSIKNHVTWNGNSKQEIKNMWILSILSCCHYIIESHITLHSYSLYWFAYVYSHMYTCLLMYMVIYLKQFCKHYIHLLPFQIQFILELFRLFTWRYSLLLACQELQNTHLVGLRYSHFLNVTIAPSVDIFCCYWRRQKTTHNKEIKFTFGTTIWEIPASTLQGETRRLILS